MIFINELSERKDNLLPNAYTPEYVRKTFFNHHDDYIFPELVRRNKDGWLRGKLKILIL